MPEEPDLNNEFPTPEHVLSDDPPIEVTGPDEPDRNYEFESPDYVANPEPTTVLPGPDGWPLEVSEETSPPIPPFQYDRFAHRPYPSFLQRSGGLDESGNQVSLSIPYWVRPDTYSERYQDVGGATVQVNVIIDRVNDADFIKYGLGYAFKTGEGETAELHRWNPMQSAYDPNLYLSELVLVNRGESRPDPEFNNWPDWNWLEYRATFTDPPFLIEDDTLATTQELYRYVERTYKPGARERKIPSYSLAYQRPGEPKPTRLSECGFVVDHVVDHVFIWHRVPVKAIPRVAIRELAGRCNDVEFDTDTTKYGINAAIETMIFRGFARDFAPYRGRDGGLYVDIHYLFQERANGGWNNFIDKTGVSCPLRYIANASGELSEDKPYLTGDLNRLFRPE